jgi:nephrocystin-3
VTDRPLSSHQRVVRVFVSSTFQDMFDEREELIKFTFPELRKRCRERQVEFVEVDLRWGITDEQKAEGKVLPICLAEIERCRPYFIGLLGERYGWVPQKIDKELAEVQPWLKEHKEKSVTELEIIHGVLQNPEMERLAFFYFRDSETSRDVEKEISRKPDYRPEPKISQTKLKLLKEEILKHQKNYPAPVRLNFSDAKTLGEMVRDDLWKIIDKRFPIEKVPTPLERERMEHEAFAAQRRKVYIGREEYFNKLDEHVASKGLPLVLLGESGSGKSALLANWVQRYKEKHPDDFMLLHFIGSTPDSADYVRILRGVMEEIKERYEPESKEKMKGLITREEDEIPTDPKKAIEVFPFWLAKASARGKFILILDALNQLEDRDNAPDLGWLPEYFHPSIRVILSTLPGRSLEALKKRDWPTMYVQPVEIEERKRFINDYLEQYSRKLSDVRVELISSAEQSANPLYLRTLLEELRVFGVHEKLEERIKHYLTAVTVDDLFELVLERLESVYERDRPGLARDAMSLIWAARRGLSEKELLDLLGSDDQPLPNAYWSPLYLATEESFVSRSGLLNFFHDFLRKAVEDRYLHDTEVKRKAHLRIADYLDKREVDDRKVEELPYQLLQAEEWERLKDCITNMEMFPILIAKEKRYELMGYWSVIGDRFDMGETYKAILDRYEANSPATNALLSRLNEVAFFLDLNARYEEAETLFRRALAICEKAQGPEHPDMATILNNLATLLEEKGNFEGAESSYRRALAIREKALGPEHPDMATTFCNLAMLLFQVKNDSYEGKQLLLKAFAIDEKVRGKEYPNVAKLCKSLATLVSYGYYNGSESLLRETLTMTEKVFGIEHPYTATSLNSLAYFLLEAGNYEEAELLLRRALSIFEKVLGPEHPETATGLNNLALLLKRKGNYEEAEFLYRRALSIREKVLGKNHLITAENLNNLALLLYRKGDYVGAEPYLRSALAVSVKILGLAHYQTAHIVNNLFNLALLLKEKAEYSYRLLLDIYEKIVEKTTSSIPEILINMAICHNELAFHICVPAKNWEEAEFRYRKSIELFKKLQNPVETANVELNLQSLFHLSGQNLDIEKVKELTRILQEAGDSRVEKGHKLLKELS